MRLATVAALSLVSVLACVAAPAQAAETSEVCVLSSTLVRTSPKKTPAVVTKLDCGAKATEEQVRLAGEVNNAQNVADALEATANAGYKVTGISIRESYTGHEVFGVYTLLHEGCCGGCKMSDTGEHADGEHTETPAAPESEVPKPGEEL